jgi:hypothetical protein
VGVDAPQFGATLATRQAVQHRGRHGHAITAVRGLLDDARAAADHGSCAVEAVVASSSRTSAFPSHGSCHQLHGGEGYHRPRLHIAQAVCTLAALFGNASHQRRFARLLAE